MDVRLAIDEWIFRLWQTLEPNKNVLEIGVGGRDNCIALFDNHNYYPTNNVIGESWVLPEALLLDVEEMHTSDLIKKIPQFDVILANQVLEHVKHPTFAMYNLYSCLKDGGTLFISTPFHYRVHEANRDGGETSERGVLDYWRFTPHGYEILFREAGFEQWFIASVGEEELNPNVIVGFGFKNVDTEQKEKTQCPFMEANSNWKQIWETKLQQYHQS